jgi:hypothetical protein
MVVDLVGAADGPLPTIRLAARSWWQDPVAQVVKSVGSEFGSRCNEQKVPDIVFLVPG